MTNDLLSSATFILYFCLLNKSYFPSMKLLLSYIKEYKSLVFLALLLAAVNQCFSLMDPLIMGKMLDRFGVHITDYRKDPSKNFFFDIMWLLLASMGMAMMSRIAKNFQDYFSNVVMQRSGV